VGDFRGKVADKAGLTGPKESFSIDRHEMFRQVRSGVRDPGEAEGLVPARSGRGHILGLERL